VRSRRTPRPRPGAVGMELEKAPETPEGESRAGPAPADRERRLARLGAKVGRVRKQLTVVAGEIRRLADVEATRPLTAAETRRAARLQLESEGLLLEVAGLREAFERLRAEYPVPSGQSGVGRLSRSTPRGAPRSGGRRGRPPVTTWRRRGRDRGR
jgi:hypothetical protein